MLATFLANATTTVLGDDTGYVTPGSRFAFRWEDWGAVAAIQIVQGYQAPVPFKGADANINRALAFRIGRSLGSLAAVATFLKTVDALIGQTGTLTLQPDANSAATMTYANAVLLSARLVPGGEESAGMRLTLSYKFEPTTLT